MGNQQPVLPINEDLRLNALEGYGILNSLREEEFDRITELASVICETPISLISLLDKDRQWFKSRVGLNFPETPREVAFCQYTIMGNTLFLVEDATKDERFANNILVTNDPNIRFYAGYPLTDPSGYNLGTLCVLDRVPRGLTDKQKQALKLLAKSATDLIVTRRQKEEYRNFERLFRLSSDLMCIYRPKEKLLKVNPAMCALTGLKPNKLHSQHWYEAVHPADRDIVRDALETGQRENTDEIVTVRVLAADQSYRRVEWTISVEESTGSVFVVGRDMTEENVLKEKLQHTTHLLEETNEVARIGGWQLDLKTMSLTWSHMTRVIHAVPIHYEPDVQTAILFYKKVDVRHKIQEAMSEAILHGTPWSFEVEILNADGHTLWVRCIGKADMVNGVCTRLYGTFQDIDDKKKVQLENAKSRAILQAFVQHNPSAVAMFDREMRYVAVSNTWLEDYDLAHMDVIGKSQYELFPFISEEGRARHQRILAGAVEQHPEDGVLFANTKYSGYTAWEMRPWYLMDGSPGGIMILTQNVTQRVLQRKQLEEAKAEAESASRAKSEFLANMSHELRTPLNGILGFAELATHTDIDEDRRQYLDLVVKSGRALSRVINDILDYSKLDAGSLKLLSEKTNLHQLVKKAAEGVSSDAKQKGLTIKTKFGSDAPQLIWIDGLRLRQILHNLLSNAVKFTEEGHIEMLVETTQQDGDVTTLRFSVADTGIGIQPANQHLIFEAFTQEDGSVTRSHGGTGLGLTVSNQLLKLMGSELQLHSTPEVGSTFYFDLMVHTAAQ